MLTRWFPCIFFTVLFAEFAVPFTFTEPANLAQPVEHFIRNERVVGSIPIVGSKQQAVISGLLFFAGSSSGNTTVLVPPGPMALLMHMQ